MKKAGSNGTPKPSKHADFTEQFDREVLQRGLAETDQAQPEMDYRVQAVIDLMASNLRGKHSVDDLARQVNLSSFRLWHLFKDETGSTPIQYLKQLRLERAVELLRHSFKTVNQIQGEVGIQQESHFHDDFKRLYGLTPLEFRQHHLAAHSKERQADKFDNRRR